MNLLLFIAVAATLRPILNCISYCLMVEQRLGGAR